MLFNSFHFLLFFSIIVPLYYWLPHRNRWQLLLLGSCYFYMAFVPIYILILFFTIVIDYFAGIFIEKSAGHRRRVLLLISLTANIGILAIFKYYNFLVDNLSFLLGVLASENPVPHLSILLPIGLSFHTFQAMSYTIEVYRGNQKAEKHFGTYALYVMFFPQLVAGPIERPQNLIHQFYEPHTFDYVRITEGLRLMAWGLFKKVVIADRLAIVVDQVFNNPHDHNGLSFMVASLFFSFQIFCDFSGYSDMALGAARVMGFNLMTNFRQPYLAQSVDAFWQRWHISLSSWFKDYLYIPLGGNRVSRPRWLFNIMIVFLISGIWHGASWTYAIWGGLHAFYFIASALTRNLRLAVAQTFRIDRLPVFHSTLRVAFTFSLVCFAWIFFRANSVSDALHISGMIIAVLPNLVQLFQGSNAELSALTIQFSRTDLAICLVSIALMETVHYLQNKGRLNELYRSLPQLARWPAYIIFVLFIVEFGKFQGKQFIYFQF